MNGLSKVSIRITIGLLIVVELCSLFLVYKSFSNREINEIREENIVNKNMFAMYIENDTGKYVEYTDSNYWPSGYKLNDSMTMCIDNKGNNITVNSLIFNNNKMTVQSNKTIFCYLYFDVDNSVYQKVRSDYTNSNGALLLNETESDEYPVYYYNGNITNNNILYGNFCWKMVRTTENGGVKLIYNGVPDEAEDGTLTCDNAGEESQIGSSSYNSSGSLAYAGYMYNTVYNSSVREPVSSAILIGSYTFSSVYYYGDTATWNGTEYELSNSDGSELKTYRWSSYYSELIGKYTCMSTSKTSCSEVYYVASGNGSNMYYFTMTSGNNLDYYKIKLAASVIDNGNGTYTLANPLEVKKADWASSYGSYKKYYYCGNLTSETCSDMYYSSSANNIALSGYNMNDIFNYGNTFEYKDGLYALVDIKEFWNWPDNYNQINNHHYTCFNASGECEQIFYIYYTTSSNAYYITLGEGKGIEDAINEMLYVSDVNQTNSIIKNKLDTWYENNIVDMSDSNNILYSSYLENTIWCNNREISTLNGWNPNGGDTTKALFFNTNTLNCSNKTDQFTLKTEAGGTEGYGNNELDYPVGLINGKEISLAGDYSYLKSGNNYWLLAIYNFSGFSATSLRYTAVGQGHGQNISYVDGIRPSVSLSNKVEITSGDGSVSSPYQVILPS